MADIKHTHATTVVPTGPTEGDGISYRGIVWFVVILAVTTLGCQALMWGLHVWEMNRAKRDAVAVSFPMEAPPPPNLIPLNTKDMPLGEPTNLQRFRQSEEAILSGYGWIDRNGGVVRIPIDRAKALVLERGFPVRGAKEPAAAAKK